MVAARKPAAEQRAGETARRPRKAACSMRMDGPALSAGDVEAAYGDRILLSARELARALGCERTLIQRADRAGALRSVRVSPGRRGYSAGAVVEWINAMNGGAS